MKVWVSSTTQTHIRFHKDPECVYANTWRRKDFLREVDLEEVIKYHRPCRGCYPDYPKPPKVWRVRCELCYGWETVRPCRHNGGVQVLIKSSYRPNGVRRWVWPESTAAAHNPLVEEDPSAPQDSGDPAPVGDRQLR